jgi:hypothetical protein
MGNKRESDRYATLADYIKAKRQKKILVAAELEIRPQVLSALLQPHLYRPHVSDELAERIASLLNQPVTYIRQLYPTAA